MRPARQEGLAILGWAPLRQPQKFLRLREPRWFPLLEKTNKEAWQAGDRRARGPMGCRAGARAHLPMEGRPERVPRVVHQRRHEDYG